MASYSAASTEIRLLQSQKCCRSGRSGHQCVDVNLTRETWFVYCCSIAIILDLNDFTPGEHLASAAGCGVAARLQFAKCIPLVNNISLSVHDLQKRCVVVQETRRRWIHHPVPLEQHFEVGVDLNNRRVLHGCREAREVHLKASMKFCVTAADILKRRHCRIIHARVVVRGRLRRKPPPFTDPKMLLFFIFTQGISCPALTADDA